MIFSSSTSSTIPYSRCKKTPGLKIYRSSRQLIKTSDCPVWILYRLLDHVLLLYKIPAKYRLLPMPPSPCCAWSPAPPGADFGTCSPVCCCAGGPPGLRPLRIRHEAIYDFFRHTRWGQMRESGWPPGFLQARQMCPDTRKEGFVSWA